MSLPRQLIECELTLRHDDPLMRDHRVHGVRVMPGVTFLDIVMRLARARGAEPERCALRDVLFIEPVVVTEEFDQRIRISLTPAGEGAWRAAGRSRRLRGETSEGGWHVNFEATLEQCDEARPAPEPVTRDLTALRAAAGRREVDVDAAYAISRQIDIHHFEFMKGLGRAWVGEDFVVADLHLSALAGEYLDHFWAHPAYLDAATVVFLLAQHRDETKARPFIPLTIERFTTAGRLPERCTVVIDRRRAQVESDDLVWGDLELYDERGVRLARLEKICYKHIRSHALITRLARGEGPGAEEPAVAENGTKGTDGADGTNGMEAVAGATTVEVVRALVAGALGREPAGVALESGFYDQGLDSTHLLKLVRELEGRVGERLYPTLLFEYSTVAALAEYLEERFGNRLVAAVARAEAKAPGLAGGAELLCLESAWREAALAETGREADLVFVEERDAAGSWRDAWPAAVAVVAGEAFGWRDARTVTLRRAQAEDAGRLFDELAARGRAAGRALFLWGWRAPDGVEAAVDAGVGSLLVLAQAALKRRLALDWVFGHAAHPLYAAVSGFARTLWRENPRLVVRAVERGGDWSLDAAACARLATEWTPRAEWDAQVRWTAAGREVRGWRESVADVGAAPGLPLRSGGVYLITGGAGGLARIFAAALRAQEPAARLVLVGRSVLSADKAAELARLGAEYRVCDVAEEAVVARLVGEVRAAHGAIRGVLHTAGVLRDAQVPGKTRGQLNEVLRPKVQGTVALDRALAGEPLDFFVLFSSTAAAMGSAGQSDYAFANAFLDAWAEEREALRRAGARSGRTLSVSWPLWADGGMTVDEATRADLAAHLGMVPLRSADGVAALARGLATGAAGWLVAAGDAVKLRAALRLRKPEDGTNGTDRTDGSNRTELPEGAVAIIGVAGRYPGARTPAELWARLRAGEDLIQEIPADRWDHAAIYDPDRTKKGRAYSKWGGFLEEFDYFEPRFFNLSPREAEVMDPQERLFLQTAWQTLENAGYNPAGKALRETGVFVGVMWNQYQLFGAEELLRGNPVAPNFSTASIANRVSYALNLSGPSLALDTMCSSSLTAIHLACESLRRGECKTALAGGVSLSMHPAKYLFLGENQMASSDGRCRSFGEGGDGYVPGEGVGAVLLKPLAQAVADGDVIHGVIRATAINHGGKASGFTVPAPRAQATVVEAALARTGVDASRVGYIEAHGTGTSLGDPIEMAGLETAFRGSGRPAGSCAIGSVKSNFGHLEAAAGVAGLTKVLLQFAHGELAPSLHAEKLNPHIDFGRSVFRVQRELAAWARPADGGARMAGVSSFGAGGANAHMVVEEWRVPENRTDRADLTDRTDLAGGAAELIVVSADGEAALRELAGALAEAVERGRGMSLRDVAFTLQTGRDGRALRRAFTATDLAGAVRGLRELAASGRGGAAPAGAAEWLAGANVDWAARWSGRGARRVALPGYPFRGERYWIPVAPNGAVRRPRLHPLLDDWSGAASLAEGVVFTKRLTLAEPVLDQHRVRGRAVLPGVAHVEMAFAALAEVAASEAHALTKLFWLAPVFVEEAGCEVRVVLRKAEPGIAFALESADGARVYSQGVFVRREARAEERLNLDKLAAGGRELVDEGYYARHAATGVGYGPLYRLARSIRLQGDELLATLELGAEWTRDLGRYRMHPGLFDAALHATADLMDGFDASGAPLLPFAAGEVEWLRPLPARLRAYAVKAGYNLCHVALLDEEGRVCAKVKNLAARELAEPAASAGDGLDGKRWFYRPRWVPVARAAETTERPATGRAVVLAFDAPEGAAEALRTALGVAAQLMRCARAAAETFDVQRVVAEAEHVVLLIGREGAASTPADEGALLGLAHRLARAVAAAGRPVTVRLVTDGVLWGDEAEGLPLGAGLHGFLRTAAKEIAGLGVVCADARLAELATEAGRAADLVAEAGSSRPREVVFRAGMRFERRLDPVRLAASAVSPYRAGGVYWIVGGLGHIGRALALRLAKTARARIALSGRRVLDEAGAAHLRALEAAGAEVLYVRADAGEPAAMERARAEIEARFGTIHGVFLSAVHLVSRNVINLSEAELRASVAPKIQATAWAVERWAGGGLDFLAVFSSASTFEVNLGQAAYAAGGTFQDALVARVAVRLPFPVRLINWGYWESIDTFVENMGERLASAGVRPLCAADGMAALERVLAGPAGQVLALDVDEEVARRLGADFSREGLPAGEGRTVALADTEAALRAAHGEGPARPAEAARAALEHYSRAQLATVARELEAAGGEAAVAPAYRAWWTAAREALRAPAAGGADAGLETREGLLARHPELAAKVALLDACAAGTADVVRGRRGALEVLFPKGSKALVEAVYAGDAEADFYNAQVRRVVCDQVARRVAAGGAENGTDRTNRTDGTHGRIRILEVGAGTGGTSRRLLEELAAWAGRIEYFYTDVSPGFVRHGEAEFGGRFRFARFQVLDGEREPEAQGLEAGSFDVVLGTNVFHALRDLRVGLERAQRLLRRGGVLVLNEITRPQLWATMTFGLTAGWWHFEDAAVRLPHGPVTSAERWAWLMRAAGFEAAAVIETEDGGEARVIVGQADGIGLRAVKSEPTENRTDRTDGTHGTYGSEEAARTVGGGDGTVEGYVRGVFAAALKLRAADLDARATYDVYGIDSLVVMDITRRLEADFGELPATLLFQYGTIEKLSAHLAAQHAAGCARVMVRAAAVTAPAAVFGAVAEQDRNGTDRTKGTDGTYGVAVSVKGVREDDIAVIGVACRFPEAETLEEFWANLAAGRCSVTERPADAWRGGVGAPGAFLRDVDKFDAGYFRITPAEAERLDPQARLFLETAAAALEDAACGAARLEAAGRSVGVFVGVMNSDYPLLDPVEPGESQGVVTGYSAIANRVSFHLDLHGPSLALDTACSSSLTALHLACQSLRQGDCRLALAGGVNLVLHAKHVAALAGMGMLSPSGRCRAFGAGADGMVEGEGVGAVLLKPLAAALRDGDPIRAVIKGTFVNAGGRTGGFTVPNPTAQAEVVAEALRRAGVAPETVTYLEAHGTGTALGDPIEIAGLAQAYAGRAAGARCAIGSVKSNLGHLESAAGVAGLCKVIVQFRAGRIAPSLFAETLNPKLGLERTPFFVAREGMEWTRGRDAQGRPVPRRAGVSSFGAGGANAHVVLEEPPALVAGAENGTDETYGSERGVWVALSAKTPEALRGRARRLREFLKAHPETALADVARTLRDGRDPMPVKWGARVRSMAELAARLGAFEAGQDAGDAAPVGAEAGAGNVAGGRLIALPTYPFARERHWLAGAAGAVESADRTDGTKGADRTDGTEAVCFERAEWVEVAPAAVTAAAGRCVLVLADEDSAWVEACRARGDLVVVARAGRAFRRVAADVFELAPGVADGAAALAGALAAEGLRPDLVINAWADKEFVPNGAAVAVQLAKGPLTWIALLGALRREQAGALECVQVVAGGRDNPAWRAAAGFGRSLMREDGRIRFRVLGGPEGVAATGATGEVVYGEAGRAWELRRKPGDNPISTGEGWREGGVYLITGGAGGLGRKVARMLARERRARLVLAGRSRADAATEALLAELHGLGGEAVYVAADVAGEEGARRAVAEAKARFGALHGVVHAAGVIRDGFLLRKQPQDARAVLAPKVLAAVWLDAATRDEALDVFVLFSSFVAAAGNAGQTDYAYANGFLDGFAGWRAGQVRAGRRRGVSVSIGWGPWLDGGMRPAGAEGGAMMPDHPQVRALSDEAGLKVLRAAAGAGEAHFTAELRVAAGGGAKAEAAETKAAPGVDQAAVERLLTRVMAEVTKIPEGRLDARTSFEDYGIDSIVVMKFNQRLAALAGGELPRTLLYESSNLRELTAYLCREYGGLMAKAVSGGSEPRAAAAAVTAPAARSGENGTDRTEGTYGTDGRTAETAVREGAIAVVGMACRFPDAGTLDRFWDNLLRGHDAVRAVGGTRWPADAEGRIYCKAGGMLEGVDEFDPQFFNLSPREAKTIDPQERLFLQTAWHALEDAGYPKRRLQALGGGEGLGAPVGVWVGVTTNDYQLLGGPGAEGGAPQSLPWSIANRLSYFLDLAGPSLPVDTACSSSLTALHLACESLVRGECRMAIVGGVNLYLHPAKLVTACQLQMLSKTGRCRSFGADADGYAPGEGVGAVILKPLADAVRDGDRIHGVIRGTAVNHGGRTHGYTVPNPRAQAALVRAALGRAGVDARTVSYVEAHGTGTALGDPIEVRALTQAFGARSEGESACALGSVKSGIGHLEAAAGIAGLIKVLLQLRHRTLAPSLHAETVNPAIDFAATPFRLQRSRAPWVRPVVDGVEVPRRAGLSSFGAGGANAHAVLEEYAAEAEAGTVSAAEGAPEVWVFSARSEEALRELVGAWRDFLRTEEGMTAVWADLAHTLRTGREAWEERLAFVAADRAELTAQLEALAAGDPPSLPVWRGRVARDGAASRLLEGDEDAQAMIGQWVRKGKLAQLAELWVTGVGVDWAALPVVVGAGRRGIVAAPGYPFARVRCWVDAAAPVAARAVTEDRTDRTYGADETYDGSAAEEFCYRPVWRPAPRVEEAEAGAGRSVLIVHPRGAEALAAALRAAHAADAVTMIETGGDTDWGAALAGFAAGGTIYFLGGLHAPAATAEEAAQRLGDAAWLEATQEAGVYGLFRLVRAAAERGLFLEPATLKIVTGGVYPVRPDERVEPFGAPLLGLAKSLAKEHPRLRVAVVDVAAAEVFTPEDAAGLRSLAERLRSESGRAGGGEVAWRAGRRYERVLEPVTLGAERADPFVEGGVYVIVGGASGIGFELSRELARGHGARLAWIGRRAEDAEIARRRTEIGGLGGEAFYVRADVADLAAMEQAAAEVRARLGTVRGVVHSALVIEENILERMSEATLRRGLAAKVTGTVALWRVFGGERLDFLLLHSSAQAFIGNPGQGNYTAACHFLDAFAWAASAVARFPVRTINWGWWSEVGHGARPEYKERFPARGLRSIAADEGVAALRGVLRGGAVQVLALKARADFLAGLGVESGVRARRLGASAGGGALAASAGRLTVAAPEPAEIARLSEAFAAFEQLGFALLLDAFRRMGVFRAPGERWTLETLEQRLEMRTGYGRLLRALVNVLRKAGLVTGGGIEFFTTARTAAAGFAGAGDPVVAAERLAVAHPALAGHARLLGLVLASYPEILRGERAAVEILFPNSSTALMERIYTGNVVAAYYSSLVARAVVARVEAVRAGRAPGARVTIIEAGAGTGGTSAAVLEALLPFAAEVRYLYTDVSPAFAKHFEKRFAARYPFAEFKVLDASRDVAAQGFEVGEADVVLAANALHATPRMRVTLGQVKRLLRRGGWLVLDEVNEVQDFATLAFGLLDGWWLYADAENRLADSPLIGSATWEALLAEAGFAAVLHTADPRLAGTGLGHDILVAESDGWVLETAMAPAVQETGGKENGTDRTDGTERTHGPEKPRVAVAVPMGTAELAEALALGVEAELRVVLELEGKELDRDRAFTDFGVDSILAIDIANRLNLRFAVRLRPTDLYSHASVRRLVAHIRGLGGRVAEAVETDRKDGTNGTDRTHGTDNGPKGNGHEGTGRGQEAMLALLRDLQAGRRTIDDVDRAWENN